MSILYSGWFAGRYQPKAPAREYSIASVIHSLALRAGIARINSASIAPHLRLRISAFTCRRTRNKTLLPAKAGTTNTNGLCQSNGVLLHASHGILPNKTRVSRSVPSESRKTKDVIPNHGTLGPDSSEGRRHGHRRKRPLEPFHQGNRATLQHHSGTADAYLMQIGDAKI